MDLRDGRPRGDHEVGGRCDSGQVDLEHGPERRVGAQQGIDRVEQVHVRARQEVALIPWSLVAGGAAAYWPSV